MLIFTRCLQECSAACYGNSQSNLPASSCVFVWNTHDFLAEILLINLIAISCIALKPHVGPKNTRNAGKSSKNFSTKLCVFGCIQQFNGKLPTLFWSESDLVRNKFPDTFASCNFTNHRILEQDGRLAPAYFSPEYKYFDHLQTVKNKTTV